MMTTHAVRLVALAFLLSLSISSSANERYYPQKPTRNVWMGHQRALVILLEWPNRKAKVSREEVEKTFFGMGPDDHSMRQYLLENSGGKYDLTGTVLPWHKARHKWGRVWCMLQEKLGDMSDYMSGCSPKTIMREAWAVVKDEIKVSDFDTVGDGKIDHIFVVHSGRLYKPRGTPADVFYDGPLTREGAVFQSQGMGKLGSMIPIGFFLHESGHNHFYLGDFYGSGPGYEHGHYGEGMWGLMGLGAWGTSNTMPISEIFRYPAPFEAASKVRSGWADAQVYTQTTRHIRLRPMETSADVAVVPLGNDNDQDTSFFFEYRSNRGYSKNPGHGLLIWRGWDLMQADGRDDLNHGHNLKHRPVTPNEENFGDASDTYPGSLGITSYFDSKTHLVVENIVETPEAVEFDVVFPTADLERQSFDAIPWSMRTMSTAFWPVSLNGHVFDYDLYRDHHGVAADERVAPVEAENPHWLTSEGLVR